MVKVKPTESKNKVSVKANNSTYVYSIKDNMSEYFAKMSENWANANGLVNGTDYSSKYYAEQSKKHSENMENYIEDVETIVEDLNNTITVAESNIENIRISSIKDINSSCMLAKESLVDLAREKSEEIQDWATIIQDNAKEIASRTSFAMFDTVVKDHVLTYEESKGLALQGTYVYKEAIAGSRYGYPDFYNKCLEEYQHSSNTKQWLKSNITKVGSLTDNQGVLSGFSANNYSQLNCPDLSQANTWEMVYKVKLTSTPTDTVYIIQGSVSNQFLAICVTSASKLGFALGTGTAWVIAEDVALGSTVLSTNKDYWIKLVFTGEQYILSLSEDGEIYNTEYTYTSTTKLPYSSAYDLKLGVSRTASGHAWTGFIDLNESYININSERWWTGADSLEYKKNSNGHIFYNISQKDQVDEIFTSTGMAWMYGVDEENERIFLPRDNYFAVNGVAPVAGNGMTLGLTDGTSIFGTVGNAIVSSQNRGLYPSNNIDEVGASASYSTGANTNILFGVTTDPTKSGIEAHLSANKDKYLYICVGNTVSQSTVTNVVDVTTTENDTTPLFTGMYFDFTPNNVSWLKGGEQSSRGGIYTFCYNELVNELTLPKYNLKVINESDMIVGVDYSEFWKVNQDNMTFTTPTKISSRTYEDIAPVVGNGMALGMTNGTEYFAPMGYVGASNGPSTLNPTTSAYGTDVGYINTNANYISKKFESIGITEDATKSGIEAHLVENTTAQLYFKVANAVQNLELLDAGEVMEAVNEINANALTRNNKQEIIGWGVPDYANGIIYDMGTATSATFTAPSDGLIWISVKATGGSAISKATINDNVVMQAKGVGSGYTHTNYGSFLVSKGDIIVLTSPATGDADNGYRFFPLKGAN